jgi:hypothetical protein
MFPNWDFWFENKPSGNPATDSFSFLFFSVALECMRARPIWIDIIQMSELICCGRNIILSPVPSHPHWRQGDRGRFFVHFFPRKVIPWNLLKNDFSKLFPRKILIFPHIFLGGRGGGKFSAQKMYEKSAPDEFVKKSPEM